MEALLVSTVAVAIAEIGDKTQLLALLLAARYRRFWPIAFGILVATVLNHALAGWLGTLIAGWLSPDTLRWLLAGSFIAVALWTLKPDTLDADDAPVTDTRSAFLATTLAFFLAEMGDKTQVATIMLAARFDDALLAVVSGSTLGMLIANLPVVALGARFAERLPLRAARYMAALLFAGLAVFVLLRS
jgi:putative Ca2+/H+ antiporter (TMEM165/GDT1 family)